MHKCPDSEDCPVHSAMHHARQSFDTFCDEVERILTTEHTAHSALVEALRPFAALLNAEGLEQIGGGTSIAPSSITVQMVKDAQAAIALAESTEQKGEPE